MVSTNQPDLIHRAQKFCEASKYRFTAPRARVLSLLADCNAPMSAYQMLASLSSGKATISPPTVYRAIEFWNKHGFIHRIASMNAYIACCGHKQHENACIFICNTCHAVLELTMQQLPPPVVSAIASKHLTVTGSTTEIYGKCAQCH